MRYGTSVGLLHDLGGDFNNDLMLLRMRTFGCLVKTTTSYAPFTNGEVERHNIIIKGMLKQLRKEIIWKLSLKATIAHALFAKSFKINVNGLSPYQRTYVSNKKCRGVRRRYITKFYNQ